MNATNLQRRKEIHREYKERVKPSGVFQIKNLTNGKVILGSSLNLERPPKKHCFVLKIDGHPNYWKKSGWKRFNPSASVGTTPLRKSAKRDAESSGEIT